MTAQILIADEHAVVRRGLRSVLEQHPDFKVCAEASDGREAVELALLHSPNVVVLEVALQCLNGIDAALQIRKALPSTEVLVFTTQHSPAILQRAISAGARGYVLKNDSDEQQIVKAVESLLRHRPYFSSVVSEALLDEMLRGGRRGEGSFLTARERQIVQLVAEGLSNKHIALSLHISVKTVETHRSASMRKVKVRTTAELVRYAIRNSLVEA